jgi:hypothetical protein
MAYLGNRYFDSANQSDTADEENKVARRQGRKVVNQRNSQLSLSTELLVGLV